MIKYVESKAALMMIVVMRKNLGITALFQSAATATSNRSSLENRVAVPP